MKEVKVFLKVNWNDTLYEVRVIEFTQKWTEWENDIVMKFHCYHDGHNYTYHWFATSGRGDSTLSINGKDANDVTMKEIARQLSVVFRQQTTPKELEKTY